MYRENQIYLVINFVLLFEATIVAINFKFHYRYFANFEYFDLYKCVHIYNAL